MTARITFRRACVGYVAAVATSALYATLAFNFTRVFSGPKEFLRIMELIASCIFVGCLLPYPVAVCYANRRNERGWGYFACCGLATALLGMALLLFATPSHECDDSYGPTLAYLLGVSLHFAASGIAGGTACWLVLKSAHDEDTVPAV